jgi:hypothetical protein
MPKFLILLIFLLPLTQSCSYFKKDKNEVKTSESLTKKRVISANIDEKLKNQGGMIFGKKKDDNTFQFATSNVLWRASLETLEEIPLSNIDYAGGVIVTDWYSGQSDTESIKITINFLSSELSPNSLKIKSFKKTCNKDINCKTVALGNGFNDKVKEKIITQAKELEIKKIKK